MKNILVLATGLAAFSTSQGVMIRGQLGVGTSQGGMIRGLSNYKATSQALALMLEECGGNIGDGSALDLQVGNGSGSCPNNGSCQNFYTVGNLFLAIDAYNQGKILQDQFPSPVQGSRCLTLAGFLGQTYYESAYYRSCKQHVSPCPVGASSCSSDKASDYQPANQEVGWLPNKVPGTGASGPSKGCTDYWGNRLVDSAHCWFGRGAIQISWLPNYVNFAAEYVNDPDQICTVGKAGWVGSVAFWQAHKAKFTGTCESATSIPSPASCDASCQKIRCDEQNKIMNVLKPMTSPPSTPPHPPNQSYVVPAEVANGGCWTIINTVCPGQGNSWSANLCTPAHAPNVCPSIKGGDTIQYNCNGCL